MPMFSFFIHILTLFFSWMFMDCGKRVFQLTILHLEIKYVENSTYLTQ